MPGINPVKLMEFIEIFPDRYNLLAALIRTFDFSDRKLDQSLRLMACCIGFTTRKKRSAFSSLAKSSLKMDIHETKRDVIELFGIQYWSHNQDIVKEIYHSPKVVIALTFQIIHLNENLIKWTAFKEKCNQAVDSFVPDAVLTSIYHRVANEPLERYTPSFKGLSLGTLGMVAYEGWLSWIGVKRMFYCLLVDGDLLAFDKPLRPDNGQLIQIFQLDPYSAPIVQESGVKVRIVEGKDRKKKFKLYSRKNTIEFRAQTPMDAVRWSEAFQNIFDNCQSIESESIQPIEIVNDTPTLQGELMVSSIASDELVMEMCTIVANELRVRDLVFDLELLEAIVPSSTCLFSVLLEPFHFTAGFPNLKIYTIWCNLFNSFLENRSLKSPISEASGFSSIDKLPAPPLTEPPNSYF